MPNRVIRESIMDSPRFGAATPDAQFLYMQLLLLADDFGLVPINPYFLRKRTTAVAKASDEHILAHLSNLADHDLIRVYTVPGHAGQFAVIPRFGNYPRAIKAKWPLPPKSLMMDIKELARFCTADAVHLRADTLVTETVTVTVTEKPQHTGENPLSEGLGTLVLERPEAKTKPKPARAIACPHGKIVALWAELMPELPQVRIVSREMEANLRARWRDRAAAHAWTSEEQGLAYFRKFLTFCRRSAFLMGQVPPAPGRAAPFAMTLSWAVAPTNFANIINRKYHQGD